MSYLGALRLHFAGSFQANVSTVNNDPAHFDNAAFKNSYQKMQGPKMNPPNGWFNPEGDASFRLLGCRITSAWTPQGPAAPSDPVLRYGIADSDGRVPAKLVDLDPEQQLVSTIWGLEVRIADRAGNTLLRGSYAPAAFTDIWDRASGGGGGDVGAGAAYQSVLEDLRWGDVAGSPFLVALQQASQSSGRLSIKFNVDGLNNDFKSAHFMCGRIVGTIGPAGSGEPRHLVVGRHFLAVGLQNDPSVNFFAPVGGINHCPAVVDPAAGVLFIDLGNALSTATPGGPINNVGDLAIGVYDPVLSPESPAGAILPLGTIAATGTRGYAQDPNWYARTAGVVALPLTAEQRGPAEGGRLSIGGNLGISVAESPAGTYLRADQYVFRMSPGDTVDIPIHAMRWGRPLAGVEVALALDPSQLQSQVGGDEAPFVAPSPPVATPPGALQFGMSGPTDASGVAVLTVRGSDPGTPRWFGGSYGIDGQVYGIRASFADPGLAVPAAQVNQWDFVSFLLWSGFTAPEPVTWTTVQPIFQQYSNLYPVMLRFFDLADPDLLRANLPLLKFAFSLPLSDPNTMPVTRDLSPAKRAAILAWLADPLPGPVAEPPGRPAAAREAAAPARNLAGGAAGPAAARGGKAAAAARRLVKQMPEGV